MDADPLTIADQLGGMLHPDDGGQPVLARDHRAVRHQAADLGHQTRDRDERRCPARIGVGGDQDVALIEIGRTQIQDDAGSSLDGPGRNRQPSQRARSSLRPPRRRR